METEVMIAKALHLPVALFWGDIDGQCNADQISMSFFQHSTPHWWYL